MSEQDAGDGHQIPPGEAPTQMGAEGEAREHTPEAGPFPGTSLVLADRYQLEEVIASGGAAIVWRARDLELDRPVAIKVLHPHLASDEVTVERFRLESVNAARLSHPNVIQIYDTGRERDVVFLVMEYVAGPSLHDLLTARGRLDPGVTAALGEQVAGALGEAHRRGVVHRDIKPGNILLTAEGVPKVTDFGIAKALSDTEQSLTNPGTLVGTAAYVAPEQLESGEVDARADVYALGVVLYECLVGQPAFTGDTPAATAAARLTREVLSPRQVRAGIPRTLDEVIVTATRRDPGQRYEDGAAMAAALTRIVPAKPADLTVQLVDTPASAADTTGRERTEPPPAIPTATRPPADRRRPQRRWLLVAFLAGLLLALMVFLSLRSLEDDPSSSRTATPAPARAELSIRDADDFDPFASQAPAEHPEQVPLAHDGDPTTAWTTETYRGDDPRFGGLKPGVGVWFDLGRPQRVGSADLELSRPGIDVQLFAAAEPHRDLVGWGRPVATVQQAGDTARMRLSEPRRARYWLVWITRLAPGTGETFDAGLREVRLLAP